MFQVSSSLRRSWSTVSVVLITLILAFDARSASAASQGAKVQPPGESATSKPTKKEAHDFTRDGVISPGKIPLIDFLRYLQLHTGKLVLYPSTGRDAFAPDRSIQILARIEPVTAPIVRSILQTNGYTTFERILADGTVVIQVRHRDSKRVVDPAEPTPILTAGDLTEAGRSLFGGNRVVPRQGEIVVSLIDLVRRLQSTSSSRVTGDRLNGDPTILVGKALPDAAAQVLAMLRLSGFRVEERIHPNGTSELLVLSVQQRARVRGMLLVVELKHRTAQEFRTELMRMLKEPVDGDLAVATTRQGFGRFAIELASPKALVVRSDRDTLQRIAAAAEIWDVPDRPSQR